MNEAIEMPERIKALPVDPIKKLPIPWFVAIVDGKADFRVADGEKYRRATLEKRCWICGDLLGRIVTFVSGPLAGLNKVSGEPPSHLECARYAAKACPFLANPQMVRREKGLDEMGARELPGKMIKDNPGVTMLWSTRTYSLSPVMGGAIFRIGAPISVEWWHEGKLATRAVVEEVVKAKMKTLELGLTLVSVEQLRLAYEDLKHQFPS